MHRGKALENVCLYEYIALINIVPLLAKDKKTKGLGYMELDDIELMSTSTIDDKNTTFYVRTLCLNTFSFKRGRKLVRTG